MFGHAYDYNITVYCQLDYKKSLNKPKGSSGAVYQRMTDNTMIK